MFVTGLIKEEYDKGYAAREQDKAYQSNHNENNSAEYYSWSRGWLDANYILDHKERKHETKPE
jgi:hypothetical protein